MTKKLIALVIYMFMLLFLVSCNLFTKSDDKNVDDATQNLNGNIGGNTWLFVSGKVYVSFYDSSKLSVQLFKTDVSNFSDRYHFPDEDKIVFDIPNAVGRYNLNFNESENQTVTLFDSSEKLNIIATEGYITIENINNTTISGVMNIKDAYDSKNSFAKGKFTAYFLQ